jgi:hypothetical protein
MNPAHVLQALDKASVDMTLTKDQRVAMGIEAQAVRAAIWTRCGVSYQARKAVENALALGIKLEEPR